MDRSEQIGLGVSTVAHGAVIAALALGLLHWAAPKMAEPPSFEVALTDTIALESRAQSHEEAQAAQAQELGATDPDDVPDQATLAEEPKAAPKPVAKPEPAKPKPTKADLAKAMQALGKGEQGKPRRAPLLGDDFLKGLDSPTKTASTSTAQSGNAPLSAEAARALNAEIVRQLKPYWRAPTGADADKLITKLTWRLNPDGTLSAGPTLVRQDGKTASNQPQQQLHIEAAIRAVRAAAPFKLPPDLYDNWKYIREFSFYKGL
ncbi:MAG: hypothetical protein J7494_09285 [Sphingobium sp.]|nr:hypothetical protein [Sphingobium sp.]